MKRTTIATLCFALQSLVAFGQPATEGVRRPAIQIKAASLDQVLKGYAETTHRTVLHATLPKLTFDIQIWTTNHVDVVNALKDALKDKGIVIIPDGDKFALAVPESLAAKVVPKSAQIKLDKKSAYTNSLPSGIMDFESAYLNSVIPIYTELMGVSGLEPNPQFALPPITISLRTQTAMTREEVLYAFDTIFELNGFKMVPAENNRIKAVPISSR